MLTKRGSRPRRSQLIEVAKLFVGKYPESLQDRSVTGHVLGNGYSSFLQQLETRVENVSRGQNAALAGFASGNLSKRQAKEAYGCEDWQPSGNGISKERAQELQTWLQTEVQKPEELVDAHSASRAMQDTYFAQRLYINSKEPAHSTTEIKNAWPMLFQRRFFLAHAQRLLGKDVEVPFRAGMRAYAGRVSEALKKSSSPRGHHWLALSEIARKRTQVHEDPQETVLIPLLVSAFTDQEDFLFQVFDEGYSVVDSLDHLPYTPVVVVLGGDIFARNKFFVVVEHVIIFEAVSTFTEATMLMFMAYYMFNMEYPDEVASTLEFIQR
ncbi:uncharacterized protein LOC135384366 [Ornithodoros turicata]|uniref:uncharacterized protein LOC135384366 n=1 Tax=Ornithodoros turicata TaxID=34597 RepID=UPI003138B399